MSPSNARSGHRLVALCKNGIREQFGVHALVLMAFVGPRPQGHDACHWDDNPKNNHLGNLRWGTRSENARDCVRNGTHNMANKTHCPQGHEYTPANTYKYPAGNRACNECRRVYREEHLEQRRVWNREYMRTKRARAKQEATTDRKAA